jgi:hypothetical protein
MAGDKLNIWKMDKDTEERIKTIYKQQRGEVDDTV